MSEPDPVPKPLRREHAGTSKTGTPYEARVPDEQKPGIFEVKAKNQQLTGILTDVPGRGRGIRLSNMKMPGKRRPQSPILLLEPAGERWATAWEKKWADEKAAEDARLTAVPLTLTVTKTSYFAMDMDMPDVVLEPSKRKRAHWTPEEKEAYLLAHRYVGTTNALHDERISIMDEPGFEDLEAGAVISASELERRVRETHADAIEARERSVRAVESVEILHTEAIDDGFRRGRRYRMRYGDEEYEVALFEEDISYGDNPRGDWLSRSSFTRMPDHEPVEPETRLTLERAARNS